VFSSGSNFTVTGTYLYSFQYVSKVAENKKVKYAHKPGSLSTAYLFDDDDNLIMAGFLTDSTTEWSTSGTYGNLVDATTTYNDDDIVYKATNDQEGVVTETITTRNIRAVWNILHHIYCAFFLIILVPRKPVRHKEYSHKLLFTAMRNK